MTNKPDNSDQTPQARRLVRRIRRVMRRLRKENPWPSAAFTCGGYFRIPINIDGSPHHMPLGFVGSTGCRWARAGGCTMCDYGGFEGEIPAKTLVAQAAKLLDEWGPRETEINLSSLGSFFDDRELPPEARRGILREVAKRPHIELLGVESRANDIAPKKILEAKSILGPRRCLEIGMGFESLDPFVRNVCINKGLSRPRFESAVRTVHESGVHPVVHVLFKPPFLSENEAIRDATDTINYLDSLEVRRIVLMVCNVKAGTLLGDLHTHQLYRPAWLWSVLETALSLAPSPQNKLLIYGFDCGIPMQTHGKNCDVCTPRVIQAIEQFNGTSDISFLRDAVAIGCPCKKHWLAEKSSSPETPLPDRVEAALDELYGPATKPQADKQNPSPAKQK